MDGAAVRLDIWLWAARLYKTRALAKGAVVAGKVEVGEQACKPSRTVHPGDRLRVTRGAEQLELTVVAVSAQRGPAAVAQGLYREEEADRLRRLAEAESRRLDRLGYSGPPKRPDKQARRALMRVKAPD
ncbi:MAG TPA: S4 domain-containing protein [Pseudomonadota bacterium]|nr:S4 domain-containing protein [Pseudomonadota bacterium]